MATTARPPWAVHRVRSRRSSRARSPLEVGQAEQRTEAPACRRSYRRGRRRRRRRARCRPARPAWRARRWSADACRAWTKNAVARLLRQAGGPSSSPRPRRWPRRAATRSPSSRPVRSATIVWKLRIASSRPWLISGWYGVYAVYQAGFSSTLRRMTGGVTRAGVAHADQAGAGGVHRGDVAQLAEHVVDRARCRQRQGAVGDRAGHRLGEQLVEAARTDEREHQALFVRRGADVAADEVVGAEEVTVDELGEGGRRVRWIGHGKPPCGPDAGRPVGVLPPLSSMPESFEPRRHGVALSPSANRVRGEPRPDAFQRRLLGRSVRLRDSGEVAPSAPRRWPRRDSPGRGGRRTAEGSSDLSRRGVTAGVDAPRCGSARRSCGCAPR